MNLVKLEVYDFWSTFELDGPIEVPDPHWVLLNANQIISVEPQVKTANFREIKSTITLQVGEATKQYSSHQTPLEIYNVIREQQNKSSTLHMHDHLMDGLESKEISV